MDTDERRAESGSAILVALFVTLAAATNAQEATPTGIQALKPRTYEEAVGCGRSGNWQLCAGVPTDPRIPFLATTLCPALVEWEVRLETPFIRLARESGYTSSRFLPSLAGANAGGARIIVHRSRKSSWQSGRRRIDSLLLMRAGEVIEPTATNIEQLTEQPFVGGPYVVYRGTFTVPFEVLAPSDSVTLLINLEDEILSCVLSASDLARWR